MHNHDPAVIGNAKLSLIDAIDKLISARERLLMSGRKDEYARKRGEQIHQIIEELEVIRGKL